MTGRFCALALLAALCGATPALAQSYPTRTVTIVVTSAAGALTDVLTRAVAQRLSQKWNQSVIVENRGGAGHNFAAVAVMKAEQDGHMLLASETGFVTIQPHLYAKGKLPYDPETDFIPLAGYASIPAALLVHPTVPAKSVRDLVALAKDKPGTVTYGTAGLGTALHTAMLLFESLADVKLTAVHYRGAAPALNDLIAGHINTVTMGPSVALPAVRAGKLKMLGFGSTKRVPEFPDVPTIAETVLGYEANVSFGLFAPAKTPREIIQKINTDVQQIINDPEFHKRFLEPMVVQKLPGPQEGFAEYLRKDSAKWAKVIKAANLKID
jgi:tripartite-type tricarboxylate transporter receptor subunit TctC